MRDGRGGVIDVDAVGPMRGLDGRAGLARAQPLDQLQPARAIQAGQSQRDFYLGPPNLELFESVL